MRIIIGAFVGGFRTMYHRTHWELEASHLVIISFVARLALENIANSDAVLTSRMLNPRERMLCPDHFASQEQE